MSTNLIECSRHGASGVTKGYDIDNSLRFNDDDSAYLSWTPSTAGNQKTWTFSAWTKGASSNHGSTLNTFIASSHSSWPVTIRNRTDGFQVTQFAGAAAGTFDVKTSAKLRDPSAWYHICVAIDTTQATASNRVKIYINGILQTALAIATYPPQNDNLTFNDANEHRIGTRGATGQMWDGYMAEVNFIDGQALTPSDFGESGVYGEWKPIEYEGTYGNNGFYLNFKGGGIVAATGGTVTTDGNYKVHSFTADGTFTPSSVSGDGYVEYLVIAGGGGTGGTGTGGGGAGGYRTGYLEVSTQAYSITVGDGGAAGGAGSDGEDSVFSTITSIGGGAGYGWQSNGNAGGSGGGVGNRTSGTGGAGTAGQGNDGGSSNSTGGALSGGGGGGGAGAVGGNNRQVGGSGDWKHGGHGGNGIASSITGSSVTRAGGGGGGQDVGGEGGNGGSGGGGTGTGSNTGARTAGTANTGGGGGGAGNGSGHTATGSDGGSGIVIIRYLFQ